MSSQPKPESIEVPPVSPEERAEWDALMSRLADGDESGLMPGTTWPTSSAYRVLATSRFAAEHEHTASSPAAGAF